MDDEGNTIGASKNPSGDDDGGGKQQQRSKRSRSGISFPRTTSNCDKVGHHQIMPIYSVTKCVNIRGASAAAFGYQVPSMKVLSFENIGLFL